MRHLRLKSIALATVLALAGSVPVLAGNANGADGPARIEMTDDGPVFVTPSGMTLYTFGADDSTPGKSQCTNVAVKDMRDPTAGLGKYPLPGHRYIKSCIEMWPAFTADADAQPSGDWSLIDRPEGGKQWTYRGRPLYTSVKDLKAGDRNGIVSGAYFGGRRGWQLAAPPLNLPPGLKFIRIGDELVLAADNDRPVFTPRGGRRVHQAGTGGQALFQPVPAPLVARLEGDWTAVTAGAGRQQYAFKGQPLYLAPDSLSNREIAAMGGWDMVVFRKLPGAPREIGTRFTLIGDVYTDKDGKTLYIYTCTQTGCDLPGGGAAMWAAFCGTGEECARRWRPYRASANVRPSGEWSVVEVPVIMFKDPAGTTYPPDVPRVKAWAYRGRPVYTYYEDKEPGDIWGNQIRWFSMGAFSAVQVPGRGGIE